MKKSVFYYQKLSYWLKKACQWYVSLFKGKPWYLKTCYGFVSFIVFFLLYLGAVDINLFWLFGRSPGFSEINKPQVAEASEVYSADGVLIGKFFNQNRTPIEYNEVAPHFWKALIDTEDERFYKHHGIDFLGMAGAVKDALTSNGARGASTITQQLAKNMFRVRTQYSTGLLGSIPGVKMLIMKSKEWIIATKLEMCYNKEEILTMYANTVDFGSNAFGIKTACKTYFNTIPSRLTVEQAAVLVGMLKATTYYNPISHPDNSLRRRNVVLTNMYEHGDLTLQELNELQERPIDVSEFRVEENYDGEAKYFREALAKHIKAQDWFDGYDLYTSGLKIYTTIDTRMQKYAEEAAVKQMKQVQRNFNNHWGNTEPWQDENHQPIADFIDGIAKKQSVYKYLSSKYHDNPDSIDYYLNKPHTVKVFDYEKGEVEKVMSTMDSIRYMVKFMHCSFVAMEPQTGYVKAWVGDIDFNHWKYDKVTASRQPGSTFKLFVYTEAMEQGLTPCDKRRDEYFALKVWDSKKRQDVTWAPTNANGYFTGDSMPLKTAFAQSVNSIAVRLGQEMGVNNIASTAHQMGIQSKLDETPSLALGASDVNLLELANAYCTVVNSGKAHPEAVIITKVLDKDGDEIYVDPQEQSQAISYRSAYLMQQMLMGGLKERGGTSMSLWGYIGKYTDSDFGGKTGTSNNHSDAWFMGVSPNLVVGAWVGGEYRCIHFRTGALGQGSRTALPICGYFLESVFGDPNFQKYHCKFKTPSSDEVDKSMYECTYYYTPKDSLDSDSTEMEDEVLLDEDGNPIPKASNDKSSTPEATEPDNNISFEDL